MDTLIGKVVLTANQRLRIYEIGVPVFKGYIYNHDTHDLVGVSESNPSAQDISDALSSATALADSKPIKAIEAEFDVDKMTAGLGLKFTGIDAINLAPYLGVVQSYAKAKNFKDLKTFVGGLLALGKATQQQFDDIHSVISEQGIVLESY